MKGRPLFSATLVGAIVKHTSYSIKEKGEAKWDGSSLY